ncbi:MAG: SpoIID/LytB domain-containing protein, partial [Endomicrobia bacterium]|nr:SpoIID/LytB domain-containing protein [Endomicrobiia bacterium]
MQNCSIFRRIISLTILFFYFNKNTVFSVETFTLFRNDYLNRKITNLSDIISVELKSDKDKILKNLTLFEFYVDSKDIDLALQYLPQLEKTYPVSQLVNYRLGEYFYLSGDYQQAKEYLEICVKNDAQFHEARKLLADIYLKLKDYKQAYRHYNVLSWFKPDKELLKTIDFLSNQLNINQTHTNEVQFTPIEEISFRGYGEKIDVGISTQDNGKLMKVDSITFYVSGNFIIYNQDGQQILNCAGGKYNKWKIVYRTKLKMFGIVSPQLSKEYRIKDKCLIVKPQLTNGTIFVTSFGWYKYQFPKNSEYRGELIIKSAREQIIVINRLFVDEYLYSVVNKEIGGDKPFEALKVQAVVARTLALYRKKNRIHKYFDICCGQHCQVYDGVRSENEQVKNAVNATVGEVIAYNHQLIHAFFHANCGGITNVWRNFYSEDENNYISEIKDNNKIEDVYQWYILPPELICSPSDYVHPGFSRWFRIVKKNLLSKYLDEKYKIGVLKDIKILSRKKNGYINQLKLIGSRKTVKITKEHKIRNITPYGPLRSASFIIEYNKNNSCYYFWGGGWGH